jgi:hypothetical protein
MNGPIDSISSEQAQRALLIFYESLPEGQGRKPSLTEIQALAEDVREEGPADIQALVSGILKGPSANDKGEVSKILLRQLAQFEPFRSYVETAVTRASQPQMSPVPLAILAVLVVIPVLPKIHYDKRKGELGADWDPCGNLTAIINSLRGLAKSLPTELINRLSGLGA